MNGLLVRALAGTAVYQDLGRRHVASGVPVGGAYDPFAHEAATRVTGGTAEEASLEITGSLGIEVLQRTTCAVAGPATILVDGRSAPGWTALDVHAGSRLDVAARGRAYLAVSGGFRPALVLGSRSTCLLGPIGPAPVGVGDTLPLSARCTADVIGDVAGIVGERSGAAIRVVPGPHLTLGTSRLHVVDASRMGLRLRPERSVPAAATMPSLGVLPGILQVVPSGDWFLLGPDAGTMGGYPVIGMVVSADLHLLAHVGPGADLALEPVPDAPAPPLPEVRVLRLGEL